MDNSASRVNNSSKSIFYGMLSYAIILILNFSVRTFFIGHLNVVYLGIEGLFSNVLTVLSLAELGIGNAMIYSMYKPLATNDKKKLQALMNLYERVYTTIALVVAVLGVSIIPFMDYVIKDRPDVEHLMFIYLLYLSNSIFSYLFAYKRSILYADQKAYIGSQYKYIFSIIKALLQIAVLILFEEFILYLLIQIILTLAENIFISLKVNKIYPYLNEKNEEKVSQEELQKIKCDVKALFLSNISRISLNGTDNIIIAAKVGVNWVGLLSNYTLITGSLIMVISQVTTAITGSIGNFIAKEQSDRHYELFKIIDFMHFWMYGFATVCLVILLNPFISLWIGEEYILNFITTVVISVNFLIEGLLNSLWTFRTTMGLFVQGKYRPIFAAVINIAVSIVLARYLGLLGVLLGTTFSRVFVNLWFDPYIIFKHGFKITSKNYFINYVKRMLVLCLITAILYGISLLILNSTITITKFIIVMMVTVTVPNIIFYVIYHNTTEFKYILGKFNVIKAKII